MEDANDLIVRLCTCAGMIMEDTSDIALVAGTSGGIGDRVSKVGEAGRDIEALANAAAVIARRWPRAAT